MNASSSTASNAISSSKESNVRLIVTGFGPFGGVDVNPTMVLVNELPPFLLASATKYPQVAAAVDEWKIVETSTQGVQTCLEALQKQPSLNNNNETTLKAQQKPITTIRLHLGVNVKGTGFQFEECAYNEASFRIPDQQGNQPTQSPIDGDAPLGHCCRTSLPVERLVESMQQAFPTISTRVSTDPGRFVCNYLYYASSNSTINNSPSTLLGVRSTTSDESKTNQAKEEDMDQTHVLFLHVPPWSVVPHDVQLEYVATLLKRLLLCFPTAPPVE